MPPHAESGMMTNESVSPIEFVVAVLVNSAPVPTSFRVVELWPEH